MLADIEAFALFFGRNAQADDEIDDLEEDRRANARPDEGQQQDAQDQCEDCRHAWTGVAGAHAASDV